LKEVMAFIRVNMVNVTKEALAKSGYPAFSCRKCLGRGKKNIDSAVLKTIIDTGEIPATTVGEHLTESQRLIAKRFFTLIVEDDKVSDVVKIIIDANQTGNMGDGKIFVLPICEAYTVRSGEFTTEAY